MRLLNHPLADPPPRRDKTGRRVARRRVWPRWVRPALRWGVAPALVLALAAGAWALWHDGWYGRQVAAAGRAALAATAEAGLAVEEILVEGRLHTPREAVLAAVASTRGAPLLGVDPAAVKARLETLPWVRAAAVERRLPGTVHVRLVERRPLAVWQRNGAFVLIDQHGKELGDDAVAWFAGLPLVVGDDANRHAADLLQLLAEEPALQRRVKAAIRVADRRWNLRFDTGAEAWLPEFDARAAWRELARIEQRHKVLDRMVSVIDLRLEDRLFLRRAPEAEPAHDDQPPAGAQTPAGTGPALPRRRRDT